MNCTPLTWRPQSLRHKNLGLNIVYKCYTPPVQRGGGGVGYVKLIGDILSGGLYLGGIITSFCNTHSPNPPPLPPTWHMFLRVMYTSYNTSIIYLHLPFIWRSMNPGLIIKFLQSIWTSARTCSSQNTFRGLIIFPALTQRSSFISSPSRSRRQFRNWYNFGPGSHPRFMLHKDGRSWKMLFSNLHN